MTDLKTAQKLKKGTCSKLFSIRPVIMKKITAGFILIFSLASCINQKAKFMVTNKTTLLLDSLLIDPNSSEKEKYISLKPGQTQQYVCDISHQSSDGAYFISFKQGLAKRFLPFGYFSNGNVMEKYIEVEIYTDTIMIRPVY